MKYVRCKADIDSGRCRRKAAWRRAYCPAHQRARDEAAKAKEQLRDLATELCCAVGEVAPTNITHSRVEVPRELYRALCAANSRLQSALVSCSSPGGVDPEVAS